VQPANTQCDTLDVTAFCLTSSSCAYEKSASHHDPACVAFKADSTQCDVALEICSGWGSLHGVLACSYHHHDLSTSYDRQANMPELPEVESARRLLDEHCAGAKICAVNALEAGGGPRDGQFDDVVICEVCFFVQSLHLSLCNACPTASS
jgi:Formamidopyrimidine-DNA glycosylase N-terminal domain